jgi:hypothetical protein
MHRLQHGVNAKISVANIDTSFFVVLLQEVPHHMRIPAKTITFSG